MVKYSESNCYHLVLIDSRIQDIDVILASLNSSTLGIVFDYETDTYESIYEKVKNLTLTLETQEGNISTTIPIRINNIGILQHNYDSPFYNFVSSEPECLLHTVKTGDPFLETWDEFVTFFKRIVLEYEVYALDFMACAIYSNENWKYIIDELSSVLKIKVRASTNDTGSSESGGDWFLESNDGVNLKDVYFTEDIEKWKHLMSFYFSGWSGRRNYVDLGLPASRIIYNNITSYITLECWFKTASTVISVPGFFISRWVTGGSLGSTTAYGGASWNLGIYPSGQVVISITNASGVFGGTGTTGSYADMAWHHAAGTYDSTTGAINIYIDGVSAGATTYSSGLLQTVNINRVTIGTDCAGADGNQSDRWFVGYISDVRLWNVARSAANISASYRRRLPSGDMTGIIGYWKLNESSGSALDSGPNTYNGSTISFNTSDFVTNDTIITATLSASTPTSNKNIRDIGTYSISGFFTSNLPASYITYSTPTNNFCTVSASGDITLKSDATAGGPVTITATISADGVIANTVTATHTIRFLRTPDYNGSTTSIDKFYADIGSSYVASAYAPTSTSFTPNLSAPVYTYSVTYLSNQAYASASAQTAIVPNTSTPTYSLVGTGQCYLTVTVGQDPTNGYLDTVIANFVLLTVRPGYIVGPNVNLTGAEIKNYNLSGINFTSSNLTNARIVNCLLANANFNSANLKGATFIYNTITNTTNLSSADFTGLTSNNNTGTTTQLSSSWAIQGGRIVPSGSVYFSIEFTLASPSASVPSGTGLSTTTPYPYSGDGHYRIAEGNLLINGKVESALSANLLSNFIVRNTNDRYLLTQVGPTATYLFELINAPTSTGYSVNTMYIRAINNSTGLVVALPNLSTPQTFSTSFQIISAATLPPYYVRGSYLFGPGLSLSNTYFDNTISPKPDLTDLTFTNLSISPRAEVALQGWNFTRTKLNSGSFNSVMFNDCNCNSVDFSGSRVSNVSFKITFTSENAAIPNIATLRNAKFTNCGSIPNLEFSGFDNGSTALNQMDVSGVDFSGSSITYIKTFFLNKTGGGPINIKSSPINGVTYSFSMISDSLIGRFLAGPGMRLNNLALGNANFSGVNFSNADISGTNLSSASLSGIAIRTGELSYSNATVLPSGYRISKPTSTLLTTPAFITGPNVDLSGVDATGINFEQSNVTGMNFTNARFFNVKSGGLTVTSGQSQPILPSNYSLISGYFVGPFVNLTDANLSNSTLTNTNLTGANFTNANIIGITSGGISTTATINNITYTQNPVLPSGYGLTRGYIIGPSMNFINTDLSGFDFTNVNLSGTNFTGSNLTYVVSGNTVSSASTVLPDASYAFLNGFIVGPRINLSSKNVSGVKFSTSTVGGFTLSGSLFVNANLTTADFSGIILDGVNFTGATFQNTSSRNIPQPTVPPVFTSGESAGYVIRNGYIIGANVDMSFTNLTDVDLSNTVLTGVNLSGSTLTNVRSGGISVLSTSQPTLPPKFKVLGGYLYGPHVDLSGANLTSYDFSTQINAINLSSANLTNAVFTNMKSGWIEIDSDASGPILSSPYVYNRRVETNPSGGFIIGPGVNLSSANFTDFDLRNVVDISNVNFTNAILTNIKTSGSIATPTAGNFPTFTGGSGYVLYRGFIIGPNVDMSGTNVSTFVFGTSSQAVSQGSTSALSGINFTNANMSLANLLGSTVNATVFTGANFLRTRTGGLVYTNIIPSLPASTYSYITTTASGGYIIGPGVDLSGTNLQGASFVNTNLNNVDMTGANINNTTSENLVYDASSSLPAGYIFIKNNVNSTFIMGPKLNFTLKQLTQSVIRNVDITGTIFTGATLNNVKSSGITYNISDPPVFTVGSGYKINSGFLMGPSVDLSGESMAGIDLSGQNLTSASFINADMSGANLYGTTLSYTTFTGASFNNIRSGGRISFVSQPALPSSSYKLIANGYNESVAGSGFQRFIVGPSSNCRGADFSGAYFDRVDLSGVDFTGASFTNVRSGIMRNTPILSSLPTGYGMVSGISTQTIESQDPSYNNALYFIGPYANLEGAFLKNAQIYNLDVTGAKFTGADFNGLSTTGLIGTPASFPRSTYFIRSGYIFGPQVNLSGGIFTGLDLSNSVLIGGNFTNADFTNANLFGSTITNAVFSGGSMTGAKTGQIIYQGYDYGVNPAGQDPSLPTSYRYVYNSKLDTGYIFGPYVDVSGLDLSGINLSYTNLTGVNLFGTDIRNVRSGNIILTNGVQPTFTPNSGYKILSGYLIGPYVDLRGNDFTNQDFSGTNLTGALFTNSIFVNVKSGNIVASPVLPTLPDATFKLRNGYIFGPNVDLSFSDLSGMDLSGVNLTNARMQNTNFTNVRSGGVVGTSAFIRERYMIRNGYIIGEGVDLSGAVLTASNLSNAYFTSVNLTNVVFSNATLLTNAKSGGNLRYNATTLATMPTNYTIRGTYIVGPRVDLSGANLTNLDLSNTVLTGVNMANATFTNMRSGGIQMLTSSPITFSSGASYGSEYGYKYLNGYIVGPGVDLTGSNFADITITSVDLSGVKLSGSNLSRIRSLNIAGTPASLPTGYKVTARHIIGPGLDMSGYNFTNGNFSGADITGSTLINAKFTNTSSGNVTGSAQTRFTTTIEPANIKYQLSNGYIVGPGVDLSNGDLSGVSISGINLTGANVFNTKTGILIHDAQTVVPSSNYTIIANYMIGPNVNLTGVDFSGVDLRYTNLTNVNFVNANLYNVRTGFITGTPQQLPNFYSFIGGFIIGPSTDLSGADLSGGNLANVSIENADLTNANFYNVSSGGIQGVPRKPLNAPYVVTSNGYIVGPNVNLNNSTMTNIDLRGLTLTNALMLNVNFENTKTGNNIGQPRALTPPYIYVQTTLSGGFIVGPSVDISYGNFSYADISTADLTNAKLSNATFFQTRSGRMTTGTPASLPSGYSILSTTVSGGYLVGPNVNLNDANFSGSETVLTGLNITNATMDRVKFDGSKMGGGALIGPPSTINPLYRYIQSSASGGYIIGSNIDLSGANFTNTDISFVFVDGINFTNVNFTNTKSGRLQVRPFPSGTPPLFSPTLYRLIFSTLSGGYIIGPNVNLVDANLTDTDISATNLAGVNMSNANLTNMRSGLLDITGLTGTTTFPSLPPNYKYIATSVSGGYIIGPAQNLVGANFTGADLSFCNFSGCKILGAIFPSDPASLRYVRSGSIPNTSVPATLPAPYKFITNSASGGYIIGPFSDLSGANLESSVLTDTDLSGANFTNARLRFARSGGIPNTSVPSVLPPPYKFITNSASGGYIIGPFSDLSGANLESSVLTDTDLSGTNFTNARLRFARSGGVPNTSVPSALPPPYKFITTSASGGYIIGPFSDLSGANLESSVLTGTDPSGANFTNARLRFARSGGIPNTSVPATLPAPYQFITNSASGGYIIGPFSDLSGANLESSVLTGTDLSGANFTNARLRFVRSGGIPNTSVPDILPAPYKFITNSASGGYIIGPFSDLSGANLESSVLTGTDLSGANFTNALLRFVRSGGIPNTSVPSVLPPPYKFITNNVSGGYIIGPFSDLSGANLESSVLTGTDISGANFTNARLRFVRSGGIPNTSVPEVLPPPYKFVTNNVSGGYIIGPFSDLSGANLESSVLTGADLSGANFTNVRLINTRTGLLSINGIPSVLPNKYRFIISAVTASGGYIIGPGVDLSGAVLTGTDLSGVIFSNTNIQNALLSNAILVNVRSGGIQGTPLSFTSGYALVDGSGNNTSGAYIVGARVDLSGANLSNCILSGLDVSGANMFGALMLNAKTGPGLVGPPAVFPSSSYSYVVDNPSGTGGYIIGPGVNISGASLSNIDLTNYDFRGVDITGVDLSGCILTNVKSGQTIGPPAALPLSYVFMTDNSFGPFIVGPNVDLSGSNLTNCSFTGLNISGASFTNATLINVKSGGMTGPPSALPSTYRFVYDGLNGDNTAGYFIGPGVDLSGARLRNLNVPVDTVSGSTTVYNLDDAYLTNANITNASFSGTSMRNIRTGGMRGTPQSLPTNFSLVVSASGGYFIGPESNLQNANLNNMVLTGMNISMADMAGATFINTRTGGLIGPPRTLTGGYYFVQRPGTGGNSGAPADAYILGPGVNLAAANLTGANLTNFDLSGSDLANVTFTNTTLTNVNINNANLNGINPGTPIENNFTVRQNLQLLKNKNNRGIQRIRTAICLAGDIDVVSDSTRITYEPAYNRIYDYIRDISATVLIIDQSGNSNLSGFNGRIFYIPSGPRESFYVDTSATLVTLPQSVPGNSQIAQYYHDVSGTRLIETSTGNTIRSLLVNNKVFLVFEGSMLGVSIVDVYRALRFPAIYEVYSYYGTRNLTLPEQVSQVHTVIGNGNVSLNWEPSFTDGKPRLGYVIEYVDQAPIARLYVPWVVYSDKYPLTNITITGLTNGTTYYFRVAAINVVGVGKYSNVVTCIPGTRPDAVSTLFINTNANANRFAVEWTDPYNQGYPIDRYTIRYRKSLSNPPINPPDTTWLANIANINAVTFQSNDPLVTRSVQGTTTVLSYPIPIPSPLETDLYEFQISGSNILGTSDFKNAAPVTNTTLPDPHSMTLTPPNVVFSRIGEAPGKVSISSVIPTIIPDAGGKKIKLSWRVPVYTSYVPYAYTLQYVVVPDISGVPVPQPGSIPDASWNIVPSSTFTVSEDTLRSAVEGGPGTAAMTIISNLTNGKKYSFKIAALNAVGRGAYSDALPTTVIPGSVPAVLDVATQLAFTINTETGGEITLYWLTPNKNGYNITNYRVRRRVSSQQIAEWTIIEIVVPSGVTNTSEYRKLTTLNLVNGTNYDFQVASKNLLGWSEYSDTLVAVPRKVPDPISNIAATALNEGLRVRWNAQGVNDGGYPITGYHVQYIPVTVSTPSDAWRTVTVDGIYSSNVDLSGLVNGITHRIRVMQINAIGSSRPDLSIIIQAVPGVVSLAPTGLFISIGNARVTLFWTAPANAGTNDVSYYYVQYKRLADPNTAYEYVKNSGQTTPRQYGSTDVSLVPNAPGYDAFFARIDGLVNGTDYSVRVAAVTQVGQGEWSSPVQGKPGTVPSKVS
jgi:uncharacterized protein YjbI with pentapeptide repeats